MDTCFECGGKLRVAAKPGRMVWDDDELYEIPTEIKISACLKCGQPHEDSFMKAKLSNSIEAQKKVKPSPKLLHLRWVHKFLDNMFDHPRMFGNRCAVLCQMLTLLECREMILTRGESAKHDELHRAWIKFAHQRWNCGNLAYPTKISMEELVPALREFCDIWTNT